MSDSGHKHRWQFGGLRYHEGQTLPNGAQPRIYSDWFYCSQCLEYAYRDAREIGSTLNPPLAEALPERGEQPTAWRVAELEERHARLNDALQDDIAALLRALGLGDHARAVSPREVLHNEILPAIEALSGGMPKLVQAAPGKPEPGMCEHGSYNLSPVMRCRRCYPTPESFVQNRGEAAA